MSLIKKLTLTITIFLMAYLVLNQIKQVQMESNQTIYNTTKVILNNDYTLFKENYNFNFYYKKHNGTLKILDKRNNYVWKSGIDHDYDQYIEKSVDLFIEQNPNATQTDILLHARPKEAQMNNTREGIANSMIVVDMIRESDPARTATQMGSSFKSFNMTSHNDQLSVLEDEEVSVNTDNLYQVDGDNNHFVFDFKFKAFDVNIKVHMLISNDGFKIEIYDNEISGLEAKMINYINIMPYLGSYGGKQTLYNPATAQWDIDVLKERKQGYAFVPDGPGAIIEFKDYQSSLSGYTGYIYGNNLAQQYSNITTASSSVPTKTPLMPLYGISFEEKAAFLSYATSGAEYMQILSRPNDSSDSYNLTNYTISFPRFMYNSSYSQVFNQAGETFISVFDDRNHFDISLNYHFLVEEPNYIGMAKAYKAYLLESNQLTLKVNNRMVDIPIRLDFVMSDSKKSLIGTEDVVVTTIKDVENILSSLKDEGIYNMNAGLLGYQKGGITLGDKARPNYSNDIGSKAEFKTAAKNLNELGIDISLALDYASITNYAVSLTNTATKHYNGLYMKQIDNNANSVITNTFYFAKPSRMVSFIKSNEKAIQGMGFSSITYDGISKLLYSDYGKKNHTALDSILMYQQALSNVQEQYKINSVSPNQYLWNVTDRFLQTPMFSSQYIVQTETVPFLQLVLNGTLELYTTYVNFSFYEQKDILKMIDYNTYPSFVLTKEPSYLLQKTNAQNYFSTEYGINKDLIENVYSSVNGALKHVINTKWIDRHEVSPSVFINSYENGVKIIINYQKSQIIYQGQIIEPLSYLVIGG